MKCWVIDDDSSYHEAKRKGNVYDLWEKSTKSKNKIDLNLSISISDLLRYIFGFVFLLNNLNSFVLGHKLCGRWIRFIFFFSHFVKILHFSPAPCDQGNQKIIFVTHSHQVFKKYFSDRRLFSWRNQFCTQMESPATTRTDISFAYHTKIDCQKSCWPLHMIRI